MDHTKKRIKILTEGVITVKGYIHGPVLTPYYEDISVIFAMLAAGIKVNEVLKDGTEVPLTVANLNGNNEKASKKNNKTTDQKEAQKVKPEPPKEEVTTTTQEPVKVTKPIQEETIVETVEDAPVTSEVKIEDVVSNDEADAEEDTTEEASEDIIPTENLVTEAPKFQGYNNQKNKNNRRK